MHGFLYEPYLEPDALANLKLYRYSAIDKSLVYKYVIRRWCDLVINLFPMWMAPNLITLLGFGFMIINVFLLSSFLPTLFGQGPSWIYLSFSVGLFLYQTFDNIDGRQARRTGTSSALGHIFDHTIDSLNCALGGLLQVVSLGVGPSVKGISLLLVPCAAMWFSTWEEYHTGTLYLGYFNGPTEGVLIACTIHLISAVFGPQIWLRQISSTEVFGIQVPEFHLYDIVIYSAILSLAFIHIPECLDYTSHKGRAIGGMVEFALLVMFAFGKLGPRIILARLTRSPFPWLNFGAFVPLALGAVYVNLGGLLDGFQPSPKTERLLLHTAVLVAGFAFINWAHIVIEGFTKTLGINCFTIKARPTVRARNLWASPTDRASCMPDSNRLAPTQSIGWRRFWFALEHEIQTYHDTNAGNEHIRPGEVAFASGVVLSDFHEYLQQKGYTLTEDERWTIVQVYKRDHAKKGKPVIILKRLGKGMYLACRTSSWGGKFEVANLLSTIQKYFAFSYSLFMDKWPPGVKHLRMSPPMLKSGAVMAIPLARNDVKPIRWIRRTFLGIGQLERLEALIEKREDEFHSVADRLRESEARIQKLKLLPFHKWPRELREGFRKSADVPEADSTLSEKEIPDHLRIVSSRFSLPRQPEDVLIKYRDKNPPRLPVPQSMILLSPWYERTHNELVDCDIFMDPAWRAYDVDRAKTMKYYAPRVVVGQNSGPPWMKQRSEEYDNPSIQEDSLIATSVSVAPFDDYLPPHVLLILREVKLDIELRAVDSKRVPRLVLALTPYAVRRS
ncbi:Choline/ethanolaminephosphotransferase [Sanghuangporus baumii]|uniref:Choline/ethanolaminephosphotransferase n=1 Tax=Sanghuangporus baumii TaxID=108892 RepID=A0A9Q5N9K3_SANBA|nr:Choline/ethanolaminephosphotransferase [Sanghuangporus baumii]